MVKKITISRMADALEYYGIPRGFCEERARNIAQALTSVCEPENDEVDYLDIAKMLEPVAGFFGGIENSIIRNAAARECMAYYICGTTEKYHAKLTALMMWAGMDEDLAAGWLAKFQTDRGYTDRGTCW